MLAEVELLAVLEAGFASCLVATRLAVSVVVLGAVVADAV